MLVLLRERGTGKGGGLGGEERVIDPAPDRHHRIASPSSRPPPHPVDLPSCAAPTVLVVVMELDGDDDVGVMESPSSSPSKGT